MNNRKTPRIRFKGFTDDWEQRKLLELVTKYEDPVETPHDGYIRLGIRSHAKGTFHEYVEPGHELETAQMHRVATNKLIFNITFAWEHAVAIANENDAGKLVSHRFPQFTLSESLRPEFLKYVILDEGFHHNLYLASPGGAGRNRVLKIKEALDYPIYYPSLEEQHKIGEFITNLDHLITLHQRKLEKLKIVKKAMLENCFPKNGEKVPRFRFSGFTGDWEQRKVSEITKFHKQGFYTTEDYSEKKKYYLLRGTNLTENKLILKDTPKIDATEKDYQAFKTEVGDFLIVRSGTVGTYGIVYEDIPAIFGSYLIDFRFDMEQVTNEFFGYFYQSESFKSQLRQIVQQSANTNINAENIKSTSIMLPIIDEQKKIGDYLAQLDHLITLHQRKCDLLKQIKKYMLQNMFPQKG